MMAKSSSGKAVAAMCKCTWRDAPDVDCVTLTHRETHLVFHFN